MSQIVTETKVEGLKLQRGKVRDVYDLDDKHLVIVTTDRISAFDVVMKQAIPEKGKVLHGISKFWFETLEVKNHFVTTDLKEIGGAFAAHPEIFAGRTMLVKKQTPFPIEAVVRGCICGSAWIEYAGTQKVANVSLPAGLNKNQQLLQPIFTPTTKAPPGQHDEPISPEKITDLLFKWLNPPAGKEDDGRFLAKTFAGLLMSESIKLYSKVASYLWNQGIILADTKLEWAGGVNETIGGQECYLTLVDECFTPDSSRMWDFRQYKLGGNIASLDKQLLRDWLTGQGYSGGKNIPDLPDDLVTEISHSYLTIFERITGKKLELT